MASTGETTQDPAMHVACPACRAPMTLSRIVPDKPGCEMRTFRCTACGAEETKLVNYG